MICALPMFGDYYTQQLLANTANTRMIGNAIVDALNEPIFIQRGAALILVLLVMLIPPSSTTCEARTARRGSWPDERARRGIDARPPRATFRQWIANPGRRRGSCGSWRSATSCGA